MTTNTKNTTKTTKTNTIILTYEQSRALKKIPRTGMVNYRALSIPSPVITALSSLNIIELDSNPSLPYCRRKL